MKENKLVKKLFPVNYWEIGQCESWLSDMAKLGLEPVKMGMFFTYFKKIEPTDIRYRIEYSSKKAMPLEQIELYEEAGWDYLFNYGHFHIFSSPNERNAQEIYTDLETQADSIKSLDKQLRKVAIATSLLMLLAIAIILFVLFLDSTPTLMLVKSTNQVLIIPLYLYLIYQQIRASHSIKKLRTSLIEGKPIDHKADWKQAKVKKISEIIFLLLISVPMLAFPIINITSHDKVSLPVEANNLPIPRLTEIEQNPKLEREVPKMQGYWGPDVDCAAYYDYSWTFLAPAIYDSTEDGIVKGSTWADGSGTYSPSISCEIYELRFKFLATPIFNDVKKWHYEDLEYQYGGKEAVYIEDDFFDNLYLAKEDIMKEVVASKDETVIYLRYYGYADFKDILYEIKHVLSNSKIEKTKISRKEKGFKTIASDNSIKFFSLDTIISINLPAPVSAPSLLLETEKIVNDIYDKMSPELTGSDISKINENAGIRHVKVSDDTFFVIEKALQYSKLSDGQFDISIRPVITAWGIGSENEGIPNKDELAKLLGYVDYKNIEIDKDKKTVYLKDKNSAIDLGGIAKGYAADKVVSHLKENGMTTAILDFGGNIFMMGQKDAVTAWTVGIKDPFGHTGKPFCIVKVSDKTVVTSGIYERYFEKDGKIYHHILSKETGAPVDNGLASVSVIADASIDADALSTMLFTLGVEKGMEKINSIANTEAIFVNMDAEVFISDGLVPIDEASTDGNFKIIDEGFTLR